VLLGALLLTGCAVTEAKWSGDAAAAVVYAKEIPLYPGATFDGAMGSQSWGDEPGSYTEGMTVWFVVEGFDRAKVLDWYERRLQNAETEVLDDGAIRLKIAVPNGEPGEDMGVVIDENRFCVFEHTRPGKHQDI
jgi:hypothetical protein